MLPLTDLQALVHSLTKSEKRYVKLFCQLQEGDKTYWQLYELLQRMPSIEGIKEAFAAASKDAPFEPARQHLGRMLLKALRSYRSRKSVHMRLLNSLQDIDLLFSKGLATAGFAMLEKAKRLALRYEKFNLFLLIARVELTYLTEQEFSHIDEAALVARQEELNEVLHRQLFIHRHASLYELLLHRYFHRGGTRSQADAEKLNDLLLEEHQLGVNRRYPSFESAQLHLHFQSTYFLMTGRYQESLSLFSELLTLFHQHPELWADEPHYYRYLMDGILTGLRSTRQHIAIQAFVEEIKKMSVKLPHSSTLMQGWIAEHEIGTFIGQGAFPEASAKLYTNQAAYANEQVTSQSRLRVGFYKALIHFGLNDYSLCLQQINQVLNTHSIHAAHPLYSAYRLLNLMVHVELENVDYVSYELTSVGRKLNQVQRLYQAEKVLLRFLRQWVKNGGRNIQWKDLYNSLTTLGTDLHQRQLFFYVDLISWAEAKMRKVPFAQVVQEKAMPDKVKNTSSNS